MCAHSTISKSNVRTRTENLPTAKMQSTRLNKLRKQLQWMRPVSLTAQVAHHLASETHITDFTLKTPSELDLPTYLKDLDDIEYFRVTYSSTNTSNPTLRPQLAEAALLSQTCICAVYTLWHILQCILSSDADLKHIRWMRRNQCPDFVTFDADREVEPNSHDYFLLTYGSGEALVVDVTAAQFGWDE
jgi:hypothetical protein